ncbi:hypothetical protein Pla123a_44090 [Posidoniimonas polymericola]|uniref:Dockerin domain-containing protein n=1 Tax=Posidoniimonas polymericola TaxID=2528002 RepID=A0A5C5XVQ7_9BACT|nr:hypothetical protein [Posidoniimonas polymericola]TWT66980.1 hypothetical protein Pla123a_44090 [Posidoniimonas polymericola]
MRPACLASAVFLMFLPGVATAQFVTYAITAEVIDVYDPYGIIDGAILLEDVLVGELQYNLSLPDDNENASVGSYFAMAPSDSYVQGSNAASGFFETTDFFAAYIEDNAPWGADYLLFYGSGDTTPSALDNPQVDYVDLDVELIDYDQTVLTSDGLPPALNLADFEEAHLILTGEWFNPGTLSDEFSFSVEAVITSLTPIGPPGPAGDFNDDGSVNAADYTVWRDGGLPASDYDDWAANYGATTGGGSAAPEPSALWLVVVGAVADVRRPRGLRSL